MLRKSLIPHLLDIPKDPKDPKDTNNPKDSDLRSSDPACPTANEKAAPKPLTIGVIGNSHSGVLAIRNLYETSQECSLPMTIFSFELRPILYAEYREDGIVHDNTGLKGATAEWSKQVMESSNPGQGQIKRIQVGHAAESEKQVYGTTLTKCTHLIYAVGYDRNTIPRIKMDGKRVDKGIKFDMHSSGFHLGSADGVEERDGNADRGKRRGQDKDLIPGLYGCGIAFPEEVEDPKGNVEAAVGFAKFFKFAERVKTIWAPK